MNSCLKRRFLVFGLTFNLDHAEGLRLASRVCGRAGVDSSVRDEGAGDPEDVARGAHSCAHVVVDLLPRNDGRRVAGRNAPQLAARALRDRLPVRLNSDTGRTPAKRNFIGLERVENNGTYL